MSITKDTQAILNTMRYMQTQEVRMEAIARRQLILLDLIYQRLSIEKEDPPRATMDV